MSLNDKLTALATSIRTKSGTSGMLSLDGMKTAVDSITTGGITPTGSITLTEEDTFNVTTKAQAVVDFSATRANLAEAVTAKGVDTLPTASFDTIATNIGLIEGGGGIEKIGTATTNPVSSFGGSVGELSFASEGDGLYLLAYPTVEPNSTNRLPKACLVAVSDTSVGMTCIIYNNGGSTIASPANAKVDNGVVYLNGVGAARFNTACTYDLYKI